MNEFLRVLQISDLHLFANKNGELLNLNTFNSFNAVLELVEKITHDHKPDLILLTGDLSQDSTEQSYQLLLEPLKKFKCDIGWLPGNHDLNNPMEKILVNSYFNSNKQLIFKNWQLILLDSHQENKVPGFLDEKQLSFLNQALSSSDKFALIFLHHHILPIGAVWLDKLNVLNNQDFLNIIDNYPQLKAVVCGHVHQESERLRNGIPYFSVPSTCVQFKPNVIQFSLDEQMPGFRLLDLYPNGEIQTKVYRLPFDPKFLPDLKSTGY